MQKGFFGGAGACGEPDTATLLTGEMGPGPRGCWVSKWGMAAGVTALTWRN